MHRDAERLLDETMATADELMRSSMQVRGAAAARALTQRTWPWLGGSLPNTVP